VSSTYLPLLSGARPQTPSAHLRTSLLLLHPFLPPLSDPTRVRRVSPWRSWRRSCDPSTLIDPSFGSRMPPDDFSPRERRARPNEWPTACESVRGPSPASRLVHLGTMSWGPGTLGPGLFLTHLLWVNRTQRHSSWTYQGSSRSRERPPKPWIQANLGNVDRSAKDLTCWSPPTLQATDRSVWADRPRPGQRPNLCPCFLPVNSVDRCERAYSPL
jgi:hypothetical protein